jgi:hypothetical protein
MALKIDYTFNFNNVRWQSGHFYSFRYRAWSNDPKPLIVLFYRITGIHPNTSHQWRLIQGINLSYLPRSHRRLFVNQWIQHYEQNNGEIRFTYKDMQRRFPWLRFGIRRYLVKPNYYIQNPVEIDFDNVEEAVLSTYDKDFSKKVKQELVDKYRRVMTRTKEHNQKTNRGLFGGGNIFRNIFNWRSRR